MDLDPRVRMLWWVAISILAMVSNSLTAAIVLVLVLSISWIWTGHGDKFVRFAIGLIPFLVVVSIVSLYPTFDVGRAILMCTRYLVLLGATRLFLMITPFNELINGIRNLPHPRRFNRGLELVAFLLGFSLMSIPLAEREWEEMKERLRMRGIDLEEGSRVQKVRNGLRMLGPLVLRVFDRMKCFFIAVIQYGYDPMSTRSIYHVLVLQRQDKIMAVVITSLTTIGIIANLLIGA